MSTAKPTETKEVSILEVIRALESKPAENKAKADKAADASAPDPQQLLASLEKKRQLINLLDGYINKGDIITMKKELNKAITDLEKIINCSEVL